MTDLALLLANPALEASAFSPTSRYFGLPLGVRTLENGDTVAYVTRRFVPQPEDLAIQRKVVIAEGDRLDLLAVTHFSDPSQWWRIADSNRTLAPDALTREPGRVVCIATPKTTKG